MEKEKNSIVFLRGKRVCLRPILKEDVPQLLIWMNDLGLTQYLNAYLPMLEADEEEWFLNLAKRKQTNLVFAIIADNDKFIGTMGLHEISWKDRTAVTGAFIGNRDYWSKGYGAEAKMILLNYAFNTLNLRKVCASVIAFNKRSYAYQLKCGYRETGRRINQRYRNGRYWDEIFMEVFKKDWLPLWRKYKKTYLK